MRWLCPALVMVLVGATNLEDARACGVWKVEHIPTGATFLQKRPSIHKGGQTVFLDFDVKRGVDLAQVHAIRVLSRPKAARALLVLRGDGIFREQKVDRQWQRKTLGTISGDSMKLLGKDYRVRVTTGDGHNKLSSVEVFDATGRPILVAKDKRNFPYCGLRGLDDPNSRQHILQRMAIVLAWDALAWKSR